MVSPFNGPLPIFFCCLGFFPRERALLKWTSRMIDFGNEHVYEERDV